MTPQTQTNKQIEPKLSMEMINKIKFSSTIQQFKNGKKKKGMIRIDTIK